MWTATQHIQSFLPKTDCFQLFWGEISVHFVSFGIDHFIVKIARQGLFH